MDFSALRLVIFLQQKINDPHLIFIIIYISELNVQGGKMDEFWDELNDQYV